MNKYLITYDLKKPGQNYSQLYDAIKALGPWWHYMSSTWIIKSDIFTANDISHRLIPYIDRVDNLLIVKISIHDMQGYCLEMLGMG